MKVRKIMLLSAIALGCFTAAAQEAEGTTEYVFQPHWYGQVQIGGQETLGETSFKKLLSPSFQVGAGYQFTPLWGARLSVNGWQSKASVDLNDDVTKRWKWNYLSPMVDVMFNMSNFIGGYNPERLVDVNIFAGVGVNYAWHNQKANRINNAYFAENDRILLREIWHGSKTRLTGRFGAAVDFRLTSQLSVGAELQANFLNDGYNSKHAGNADWYFNGYVGVKYCFGKTYSKRVIPAPEPVVIYQDRVVEKIVEVPCPDYGLDDADGKNRSGFGNASNKIERNVFFTISSNKISVWEMQKVTEIAEFMKANPNSKVVVTGYADKGTGTKSINLRLCTQRAGAVADALIKKYGISADRITTLSMTYDTPDQPFETPELNRVAICVAE